MIKRSFVFWALLATSIWGAGEDPQAQVAVAWNFDVGTPVLQGWVVNNGDAYVGWNADPSPAVVGGGGSYFSAPNSLNYNNATGYDSRIFNADGSFVRTTNSGTATSPAVDLSTLTSPKLTFWCNYQTETSGTSYDRRILEISKDDFATKLLSAVLGTVGGSASVGNCASMGLWHEHTVLLDPSWGTIRIRFGFNTLDPVLNEYPGWFVDDVRILTLSSVLGSNQTPGSSTGSDGGCSGSVAGLPLPWAFAILLLASLPLCRAPR